MKLYISRFIALLIVATLLNACASRQKDEGYFPHTTNTVYFTKASFKQLNKWNEDDHLAALKAFKKSCRAIRLLKPTQLTSKKSVIRSEAHHWLRTCKAASATNESSKSARIFWEKYFSPYKILNHCKESQGKITGYTKIALDGSLRKTARFKYPIYKAPPNLIQISGTSKITRAAIYRGALKGKALEIAWTDNPGKLYFMHIQGSGIINLPDGRKLSVNYASSNGFGFRPLTKILRKYHLKKWDSISIAEWLNRHMDLYYRITSADPSFVFFRLSRDSAKVVGAQGVSLTPGRSIAIDSRIFPYLTPMWVESYLPRTKYRKHVTYIHRLMIAQDRGAAICGGPRCDIFCGNSDAMEHLAGGLSSPSIHYSLFPKTLDIKHVYRY